MASHEALVVLNRAMCATSHQRIRVAIEGKGPLVLMVHGFPESWYSWRHQIGPDMDQGRDAT